MELLDRYLQAVKKHLPWERQDDIIAELKANLEAQLEDKEAELGRPLTAVEAEEWLKQIGQPIQVAARYRTQRYLIGPEIFPAYWFVLRTVLLWAAVIYTVANAVLIVTRTQNGVTLGEAILRIPGVLMQVAAWITLIFAAIEFAASHYPAKCPSIAGVSADWAASELPPLGTEANTGKKPRSFGHAVTEVVFGFIALVWLALIPKHPYLLMGPGAFYLQASPFQAAPVWVPVFWSIVALNLIQLGWRCIDLIRGSWRGPRLAQNFTVKIFGLIPLALMLTVRDQVYFNLRNPAVNEAHYGAALASINHAIHLGLAVVCVIVVAQLAWDLGRTGVEAYRIRAGARR